MKKFLSILLAAMLAAALLYTAALAESDSAPQPEGGKKFESNWALAGGLIQIVYEEEGYRVNVELVNNEDWGGNVWEYNCYYVEKEDALVSVSSSKYAYTRDPKTFERIPGEYEYEGFDEKGQETVFTIGENGALIWKDGRGNAGYDLEFRNIGEFDGVWRSTEGEEPVWVEMIWNGLNQEEYNYTVFIHRGDDTVYTEFNMIGQYDEETKKLTCEGKAISYSKGEDGTTTAKSDDETYDACFSKTEDGKLLFETANGIVLEYDLLGRNSEG